MRRPSNSRRRRACKHPLTAPHVRNLPEIPDIDIPPLTKEIIDLALEMTCSNSGICGIILTGPGAGEPKAMYLPAWPRNANPGTTSEGGACR